MRNRQKNHPLPLALLRRRAENALTLLAPRLPRALRHLEITFLSPRRIARVHADFLHDPTPTDVITFQHGEILICPAVAEKQRKLEGLTLADEVLTYILHGLLHLCGEDDHTPAGYRSMRRQQIRLLRRILRSEQAEH